MRPIPAGLMTAQSAAAAPLSLARSRSPLQSTEVISTVTRVPNGPPGIMIGEIPTSAVPRGMSSIVMAISIIRREWVIDHVTPTSVFLPAKDGQIGAGHRVRPIDFDRDLSAPGLHQPSGRYQHPPHPHKSRCRADPPGRHALRGQ